MCSGIEIAGLLASVGGAGAGIAASIGDKNAMNSATANELARQQNYAKQGQSVFQDSLNQSTPEAVQKQMNAGNDLALQEYQKLQGQPLPYSGIGNSALSPSLGNVETQNALVGARVGQQNTANAALQGYGASDVAQSINDLSAKSPLGQIGNFAQTSENVLPLELQAAAHKNDTLAGIGSLVGTAGGLLSLYGALNPTIAAKASVGSLASTPSVYGPLAEGTMPAWGGLAAPTAANMGFGPSFATQYAAGFPSSFGGWGPTGVGYPSLGSLIQQNPDFWEQLSGY